MFLRLVFTWRKEERKEEKKVPLKKIGCILCKIYFNTLSSQDQKSVRSMQIVHDYLRNPFLDWKSRNHRAEEKFKESNYNVFVCMFVCHR